MSLLQDSRRDNSRKKEDDGRKKRRNIDLRDKKHGYRVVNNLRRSRPPLVGFARRFVSFRFVFGPRMKRPESNFCNPAEGHRQMLRQPEQTIRNDVKCDDDQKICKGRQRD